MAGACRGPVASLVVFALAGCAMSGATSSAGGGSTAGGSTAAANTMSGTGPPGFDARARQVVAQWDRSPLSRVWHTGVVVLSPDELTSIPDYAGFSSGHQKDAFYSGRFTLDGVLPSSPATGRARWATGATITLPMLSAQAAFRRLAVNRPCVNGPCGHLTVTGARPSSMVIATNRGQATVPAWAFTVAQLPFPVTRAALVPGTYAVLPAWGSERAGQLQAGASVIAVSADQRVLTVKFLTGACVSVWRGLVYSAPTAVVVGSWSRDSTPDGSCTAVAVGRQAQVRLPQPLGTRVILDAATGFPVVPPSGG